MANYKDYFSFETIRDTEGNVICYFVTAIGTIEQDGLAKIRTDLGTSGDQKMAFGRLTVRNQDKRIRVLTAETGCRIYSHSRDLEDNSIDIINFSAKDWHADVAYSFNEGDRVLVEGRAYFRTNAKYPERPKELSITASGLFLLGRRRVQYQGMNKGLIPQK